jgi:hypothetical protein
MGAAERRHSCAPEVVGEDGCGIVGARPSLPVLALAHAPSRGLGVSQIVAEDLQHSAEGLGGIAYGQEIETAEQIRAGYVVMEADLAATDAAEKFLCPIRAAAIVAVGVFVIDAAHFEFAVQAIPRCGFVDVNRGSLGDARADERLRLRFALEHGRDGTRRVSDVDG